MSQLYRKARRLICVYAANSGYCDALRAITHDGPNEKPEWRDFKRELWMQIDQMTFDDLPPLVRAAVMEEDPPCIVVRLEAGEHFVPFPADLLKECGGSVARLREFFAEYQAEHNLGLGLPEPAQLSRITQPSPAD